MEEEFKKTLFDLDEIDIKQIKEVFFTSDTLSFELVPIIAMRGHQFLQDGNRKLVTTNSEQVADALLACFGYQGEERNEFISEINRYAEHEAHRIKRDSKLRRFGNNRYTSAELIAMWEYGALSLQYDNPCITAFLYQVRRQVPRSKPWDLCYSQVARYLMNGLHDRFWYEKTYKEVVRLYPNDDPKIIFELLAITSIRETVKGNTRKFRRARHQLKVKKVTTIKVRKGQKREELITIFDRHIDAAAIHLHNVSLGKSLMDLEDPDQARKIAQFMRAMLGDPDGVPVDIHIMRAFNTDIKYKYVKAGNRLVSRSPTSKLYDAIHEYLRIVAKNIGFETRQTSACIWAGRRGETGDGGETGYGPLLEMALNQGLFAGLLIE